MPKKAEEPKDNAAPNTSEMAKALGRLGGLKGGPARAKKRSKAELREYALKGARARWGKPRKRNKK
jgi:hypothetical protein